MAGLLRAEGVWAAHGAAPPVYDMDFAAGTALHADFTFVRATVAWQRASSALWESVASGALRYHHDGAGSPLGIMIEEQRTNSLLQARNLAATWTISQTTEVQDQVGIDGAANTAWTVGDANAGQVSSAFQNVTISNNAATHVFSHFVKKDSDTSRFPGARMTFSGGTTLNYDIQYKTTDGVFTHASNAIASDVSIDDHGNWWRTIVRGANNTTGNTLAVLNVRPSNGTTYPTAAASAQGTIVFDFGQLELNASFPTSPILTTTAAATRNADVIIGDVTGDDLAQGYVRLAARAGRGTPGTLWQVDDGSSNNLLRIFRHTDNSIRFEVVAGGVQQALVVGATIANLTSFVAAASWVSNAFRLAVNGTAATADTSGSVPTGLTAERLGSGNGTSWWNATIAAFRRGGQAKSNIELEGMT